MKLKLRMLVAVIYTALSLGANPALAEAIADLRDGDMKKLILHDAPKSVPEAAFLDANDAPRALGEFRGKWIVLNFWATWCAPCRKEMPSLDRLQALMPEIAVVPVATGRNPVPGIEKFYRKAEIANLPVLRDTTGAFGRQMGVMALPVTVILNPEGQEVARLIGDAEWDSESALAVLRAFTGG